MWDKDRVTKSGGFETGANERSHVSTGEPFRRDAKSSKRSAPASPPPPLGAAFGEDSTVVERGQRHTATDFPDAHTTEGHLPPI